MQEERRMMHAERMLDKEMLLEAIRALGGSAERLVSPVGRGVERADLLTGKGLRAQIDEPTAEAIRESNRVVWEKIAPLDLETDGFKFHTSGLSVRNPEGEGFMMATVKDPVFKDEENVYTEAAQRRAVVRVLARKGRRNGILARLEILEFAGVISDNAA